jgi:aminodeoxyfutalosine synthase
MTFSFADQHLNAVQDKLLGGERLDLNDGMILYHSPDLIGVGLLADGVRRRKHANRAYFIYNQHLNYTNVCINKCLFCAYAKDENQPGAFVLTPEDVKQKLLERIEEPIRELHVVGGINPALPFDYYLKLLQTIQSIRPEATIKAFTAVEIDYLSQLAGLKLPQTIQILKEAGLSMVPGGGAEVMSDRVWQKLFPTKINHSRWLEVMEAIHDAGLISNATLLYGHVETAAERVQHMLQIRALQDQTGGFSAFIPLAFHSQNTRLDHLPPTTGFEDLKNIAVARLLLDNFEHIKAYWVMIGEKLAQVALSFGADDLDGTLIEEKISHTAGAKTAKGLSHYQMRHLIRSAGFEPVERDSFYQRVENGLAPEEKSDV